MKYVYRGILLYILILLITLGNHFADGASLNALDNITQAFGFFLNPFVDLILVGFNLLYMQTK